MGRDARVEASSRRSVGKVHATMGWIIAQPREPEVGRVHTGRSTRDRADVAIWQDQRLLSLLIEGTEH